MEKPEKKICGSPLRKKPGQFCQRTKGLFPNGRCKLHGGRSVSGPAHYRWKDGNRSILFRNLPKKLANGAKAIRDDQDLTELHEDLRLQASMINAALAEMDKTEAPPWGKAVELLNDCKTAKTKEKFEKAFAELEQVIRTGKNAVAAYERLEGKIRELLQERTKTAAAEWKRRVDLQGLVEIEKVQGFNRAVLEAIAINITDKVLLKQVVGDVLRLMPPSSAIIEGRLAKEQDDGP